MLLPTVPNRTLALTHPRLPLPPILTLLQDTVIRIAMPMVFGIFTGSSGRSAQYSLSMSQNISHTRTASQLISLPYPPSLPLPVLQAAPLLTLLVWAELVNERGGITIGTKTYQVELVFADVGHTNTTTEAALVRQHIRDVYNGRYGRIDVFFPAYTSSYAVLTFQVPPPPLVSPFFPFG